MDVLIHLNAQGDKEDNTPELFKEQLMERLATVDINHIKEDIIQFVRNPKKLDIWSND